MLSYAFYGIFWKSFSHNTVGLIRWKNTSTWRFSFALCKFFRTSFPTEYPHLITVGRNIYYKRSMETKVQLPKTFLCTRNKWVMTQEPHFVGELIRTTYIFSAHFNFSGKWNESIWLNSQNDFSKLRNIKINSFKSLCKSMDWFTISVHKKWSFPLRISSVNVTKSAVSCWFGHIYWRNP